MILYCIRHGESVYNAEGRIQGHSDVPLSELGLRQSEAVTKALGLMPIEAIFSSPLRRARQTAEVISEDLLLPVRTDNRLKEIHAGVFQGKLRAECEELYPQETEKWTSEDPDYAIPGGESRRQLMDRGVAAFRDIGRGEWGQAVVVAHGRLLVVTLKALVNIPPTEPPFALQNGSITELEVDANLNFRIKALDQVEHLAACGMSGSGDL